MALVEIDIGSGVKASASNPLPVTINGAESGEALLIASEQTNYTLLSNETATGASVPSVVGGSYIWSVTSEDWNGATVTLQALGPDGVTWIDVLSKTANFIGGVAIGHLATVRDAITGGVPSAGVYSDLT